MGDDGCMRSKAQSRRRSGTSRRYTSSEFIKEDLGDEEYGGFH